MAFVVGVAYTKPITKSGLSVYDLVTRALFKYAHPKLIHFIQSFIGLRALSSNGLEVKDLDGLLSVPSLGEPKFMVTACSLVENSVFITDRKRIQ